MIDNTTMGFLVSDSEKNLVLYMYQPESRESLGGLLLNLCNGKESDQNISELFGTTNKLEIKNFNF
jgi:hypothetical protein